MIHVDPQPEPDTFDRKVRRKGLDYLRKKGIAIDQPLPPNTKIYPYWSDCQDELYEAYQGICAYIGERLKRIGDFSVDHFIAKSMNPGVAYDWSNYRLACRLMNSRKLDHDDVLDPFEVETGWFHLQLDSGHIYPAHELPGEVRAKVEATIRRLRLDDQENRRRRLEWYEMYREFFPGSPKTILCHLQKHAPLIWHEIIRQGPRG